MATGNRAGRPSKPVERKRATGNPSKRPLPQAPMPNEGLPALNGNIPKPPRDLGAEGKKLWGTIWLAGKSWLSPQADLPIIILLCNAYDELDFIRKEFKTGKAQKVYLMPNGAWANHPYIAQRKELHAQCTAWLSMLGFSPSDRSRLGLGEVRENDPMDELERRRKERIVEVNNE